MSRTSVDRLRRRAQVEAAALGQGNMLGRRQLFALGCTRSDVRAEIQARRWHRRGRQCVQVGEADPTSPWWRALIEVGPAAVLDGVSALLVAGLRTLTADQIHVAVPQGAWFRHCRGVHVHETRRYREEDVLRSGIPRMKAATAAVHAALWAPTDKAAALFIVAPFQQRLMSTTELADAVALVKRNRRRALLRGLLHDVCQGVESLGEREFAAACRRRRFPEPVRQVARRLPSGRVVYDTVWEDYRTKAEIDGAQHYEAAAATHDALKQNAASITGWSVVRVPNFAFRANPGPFLDQIDAALRRGGWEPSLRPTQRAC